MGLVPLSISGAGVPFNQWGWVPLQSIGGRIYSIYLAPWSTRLPSVTLYGAQHVWFCPTADQDLRGWVPFHYMGRGPLLLCGVGYPFYSVGLGLLSIRGAGSPFKQWGWVPFPLCSVGLGPLAIDWWEDLLQIPSSLEHPPAFYGAQHVWFYPTCMLIQISGADPNLRGWVPFYGVGLDPPFILQGCVPF